MAELKFPTEEMYAPIYSHLCHPNTIYINACLVHYDGGYWYVQMMMMIRSILAPNYTSFVSFSMVHSEVNAESVYMFSIW